MDNLWNYNYFWNYNDDKDIITRDIKEENIDTDNINDIFFKIQKCLSGVSFTYTDSLDNVYEYSLLTGDGNSLYNMFNEYDIMNKFMKNFMIVDVSTTENIDLTKKHYQIDNVNLLPEHLILVKDQDDTTENNIYKVNSQNLLTKTDYLNSIDKSWQFKAYVKLGEENKTKQFFLGDVNETFPTSDESKGFLEKHSYVVKHKLFYNIYNERTSSGNTNKLLFSDYELPRKIFKNSYENFNTFNMDISSASVGDTFKAYYFHQQYNIDFEETSNLYERYIKDVGDVIPTMTSNTTPSGECSGSTIRFSSTDFYKAFDDSSSGWTAGNNFGYIYYKFDTPKAIWKYTLSIFNSGNTEETNGAPLNWVFEGSDDGINYTVLDKQTNRTLWNIYTHREFEINNQRKYQYYRLNVSANNGSQYLYIGEIQMYEYLKISGVVDYNTYSSGRLFNRKTTSSGFETYTSTINISDFSNLPSSSIGDFLEIEFRKEEIEYLRFKTKIKAINVNDVDIDVLVPEWVIKKLDDEGSQLDYIVRNLNKSDTTNQGLMYILESSMIGDYLSLSESGGTIHFEPKQNSYNIHFDYNSLSFEFDSITKSFETDNQYLNYKLYEFLNRIYPSVFTDDFGLYNDFELNSFTHFYLQSDDLIRINPTNTNELDNFKPYTFVNVTGSTNTGKSLIIDINREENYIILEQPKGFSFHETINSIQNIKTLKEISDTLYNVYVNQDFDYYRPKNEAIRKNIYLNYGLIINESESVRFFTFGLLHEDLNLTRDFVLRIYKYESDNNVKYLPIEVFDVGIDKKTMIPKALLYPQQYEYSDNTSVKEGDWNILEGDMYLTYLVFDNNVDDDFIIDSNLE